jgi:enoyl-CoA hydratase/carnithine racemase
MAVGGALHQVADADLIIAAEHAELVDTHLQVGNVFALEPAVLLRRMPLSMVMQLALMTKEGRITAQRGHEIGLINEVVPSDRLQERAREIALGIASCRLPPCRRPSRRCGPASTSGCTLLMMSHTATSSSTR